MIDLDAWIERAAIMEYCGGMSRFQAETEAARQQGVERYEVMNEIGKRNSERRGDQRQADARNAADDLSAVQRGSQEKARPMSKRDVQG